MGEKSSSSCLNTTVKTTYLNTASETQYCNCRAQAQGEMPRVYDNWEKLVTAVIRRQQLWELCHDHSRSPSVLSEASSSDFFPSSRSSFALDDASFAIPRDLSQYQGQNGLTVVQSMNSSLVFFGDFWPPFDLEDVLNSTAKMIGTFGRGTFGSAYTAKLDHGHTIVVKRLNSISVSEQDFKRHMEIIGSVKHKNVAALRAYYTSKDEKLMLYDHYNSGSVYALLHGETGHSRAQVDWVVLLRIAIGAARGICHIHTQNGGRMVHGNIKASNVFLNGDHYGRVSDLGFTNMVATAFVSSLAARGICHIHTQNGGRMVHGNIKASNVFLNGDHYGCVSDLGFTNMVATAFVPNAHCYAPEVKSSGNVSQASDVYSFGIFLLELLTRKSPVQSPSGLKAVDLVKFVISVNRKKWSTKVIDVDFLLNPTLREQIVRILEIGISCVARSPTKRPKMSVIVRMLEDISMVTGGKEISAKLDTRMNAGNGISAKMSMMNAGNGISAKLESMMNQDSMKTITNKLVFFGDPTFGVEDLLRASAKVPENGECCINGTMIDRTMFYIQKWDAFRISKEFQHRMMVLGRLRHANVAGLRAYYLSEDETLVIYDFYGHYNVSLVLHERLGGWISLNWKTRLKIAVGAARGIAYIHTKNDGNLVHGDISASSIILKRQHSDVIPVVGLTKLIAPAPVKLDYKQSAVYRAPEIKFSSAVSQASDVYSLGVVLLELLSGETPYDDEKSISVVELAMIFPREVWTSRLFDQELLRNEVDVDEEMVKLMEIAIWCVASLPEARPKMTDIVEMLEEIVGSKTEPMSEMYEKQEVIEEYEPGVFLTIVANDVRQVHFSPESFTENQGEAWWHANGKKVLEKYAQLPSQHRM